MDFIEQWFGVSPDGGNGFTEMLIVLLIFSVIAFIAFRFGWRPARKRSKF